MYRRLASLVAALLTLPALLVGVPAARACEPYTFDDGEWGLERGVQWVFLGTVAREESNAELPDRPNAVVIDVERTVRGGPATPDLRIAQDAGCDGFWYRRGDRVAVAVPSYAHFSADPRPLPFPSTMLTNYAVAVWVLDGDRVAPGRRNPLVDGRRLRTLDDLLAALTALPDTARAAAKHLPPVERTPVLVLAALGGAAGILLWTGRRRGRPRA